MAHPLTSDPNGRPRPPVQPQLTSEAAPEASELDGVGWPTVHRARTAWRLSAVAAALIAVGGYVHYCLYRRGYRFIPTIGVGFVLQFTASALLGGALLAPSARVRLGRRWTALDQVARVAAVGLGAGTLGALAVAHTPGGLFRFREMGLRPAPQTLITIVVEAMAVLVLGLAMAQAHRALLTESLAAAEVAPPAVLDELATRRVRSRRPAVEPSARRR